MMVICPLPFLPKQKRTLIGVAPRVRKPGAAVPAAVEEVHRLVVLVRQLHGIALLRGFLGGFRLGLFLLRRGLFFSWVSGLGSGFGSSLGMVVRSPSRSPRSLGGSAGVSTLGSSDGWRRGGLQASARFWAAWRKTSSSARKAVKSASDRAGVRWAARQAEGFQRRASLRTLRAGGGEGPTGRGSEGPRTATVRGAGRAGA